MIITSITVSKLDNQESKLCGIANITFNNMIAIHDIKIIHSQDGWLLAMPRKKYGKDLFKDVIHPIDHVTRTVLEKLVIEAYLELEENACNRLRFSLKENCFHVDFEELSLACYEIAYQTLEKVENLRLTNDITISAITLKNRQPSSNRLQSLATIVIDDQFVIRDIKIIEGANGLFLGMPSTKLESGSFADIAHPVTKDVRAVLKRLLFEASEELAKSGDSYLNWKLKEEARNVSFLELCPEHFYTYDFEKNVSV